MLNTIRSQRRTCRYNLARRSSARDRCWSLANSSSASDGIEPPAKCHLRVKRIVPMLANSSLVAFVATTDATKAHAFYGSVLELQFISEDDFAIVYDASGVRLRIQKVASFLPQPFTVLGWSVMSIERTEEKLLEKDVTFQRYPSLEQASRRICRSQSGS